jgi:hypothetical protein
VPRRVTLRWRAQRPPQSYQRKLKPKSQVLFAAAALSAAVPDNRKVGVRPSF